MSFRISLSGWLAQLPASADRTRPWHNTDWRPSHNPIPVFLCHSPGRHSARPRQRSSHLDKNPRHLQYTVPAPHVRPNNLTVTVPRTVSWPSTEKLPGVIEYIESNIEILRWYDLIIIYISGGDHDLRRASQQECIPVGIHPHAGYCPRVRRVYFDGRLSP